MLAQSLLSFSVSAIVNLSLSSRPREFVWLVTSERALAPLRSFQLAQVAVIRLQDR